MDYQLKGLGKSCAATGEALIPGEVCFSALIERQGEFVRLDFSEDGWTGPPEGAIAHWKSTVPQPEERTDKPLDPDALMRYFEQLSEEANPAQDKFRYCLALLLLQKRRLKLEGSRGEGGADILTLIGSRGEGPFEVPDPQLDDDEVEQLQGELAAYLAAGDW